MSNLEILLKKFRVVELAEKMGVAPSTVWNWKAGSNKPSRMAQRMIDELAKTAK